MVDIQVATYTTKEAEDEVEEEEEEREVIKQVLIELIMITVIPYLVRMLEWPILIIGRNFFVIIMNKIKRQLHRN